MHANEDMLTLLIYSLIVAAAMMALLLKVWRSRFAHTEEHWPGTIHDLDSTLPVLGNYVDTLLRGHDFHDWITETCKKYNWRLWRLKSPGRADVIVVSSPEIVKDITKTHFDAFIKGDYLRDWVGDYFGDGIFTSDGDRWLHHRKTAAKFFSTHSLRDHMTSCIQRNADDLYRVLAQGAATKEHVDLQQLFKEFTFQAFAEMGFGVQVNCIGASEAHPYQAAMTTAMRVVGIRFRRPVWVWKMLRWLDIGEEATLRQSVKVIDEAVYKLARQSIEASHQRDTHQPNNQVKGILELFLQVVESDTPKNPMALSDLRDFALIFMVAGRDTTAETFTWFFYLLGRHPAVEQKIRDEMQTLLPEFMSSESAPLTLDDAAKLVYLEAAIKETLRLYPIPPLNIREVAKDTVLSNRALVRKGELVGLATYAMARNPLAWGADATEFKPDRWIDPKTGKLLVVSAFKFIAFHAGPRSCLGERLAMLELKLVTVNLLHRFKFKIHPGNDGTYATSMSLPMKHPLLACVTAL